MRFFLAIKRPVGVEFNYKRLAPRTRNMKMAVDADVEIYHPQESFTSLHHDQTLQAGDGTITARPLR